MIIDFWLCPDYPKFISENPKTILNFYGEEKGLSPELKKNCLTISPFDPRCSDEIEQEKLGDFNVKLWASKSYLKTWGTPKSVKDLESHLILCQEKEWPKNPYPTINWYRDQYGDQITKENTIIIRSSLGIIHAAQKGLGIFSLSEESLTHLGYLFEPVLPEIKGPTVDMRFTYPAKWKEYKSLKLIRKFIHNLFSRHFLSINEKIANRKLAS